MANPLDGCIDRALSRRRSLIDDDAIEAYRIFNGRADGIAGLVIDRFGDVLAVQLHEGRLRLDIEKVRPIVERVHEQLRTRAVYQKVFVRDRGDVSPVLADAHRRPEPWIGEPVGPERIIVEHGLRFIVRPHDGFSVGLFLEHRENRRLIREAAAGRRVLNAFAYTCGFSVAAAAGGAANVASVDLSQRFLEWGKRNFAANHLSTEGHWFFRSDIFDYYKRAARQHRRYDLIILDPPTFSRSRRPKRVFVLEQQLDPLLTGAIDLLDPGGLIFLATNHRQISRSRLEEALTASAQTKRRRCTIVQRPELPLDFAGDPDYSKTVLARFD